MPTILRTAIDLLMTVGKRYLNPRRRRRRQQQHRFIRQQHSLIENKQYRSFIRKCFPYFHVKSLQLSSWIQLWPTIQSLMIHIVRDGRKLHYHWKVIHSIRKLSRQSLIIKFDLTIDMDDKLIVKFSTHWERECFLLICKTLGRIPERPTTAIATTTTTSRIRTRSLFKRNQKNHQQRLRWILNNRRHKKFPIIRDLPESQLNNMNQRDEQRKILKQFLSI